MAHNEKRFTLSGQVIDNLKFVRDMRPRSIEDFVPLIEVDSPTLGDFTRRVNEQCDGVVEIHPIYLFSEKLNVRNSPLHP